MTISELIEKLQVCKDKWGDLIVFDHRLMPITNLGRESKEYLIKKRDWVPEEYLVINFIH